MRPLKSYEIGSAYLTAGYITFMLIPPGGSFRWLAFFLTGATLGDIFIVILRFLKNRDRFL